MKNPKRRGSWDPTNITLNPREISVRCLASSATTRAIMPMNAQKRWPKKLPRRMLWIKVMRTTTRWKKIVDKISMPNPTRRTLVWYSVSSARKWDTIPGIVQIRRSNKTTQERRTSLNWNVTHVRV